MTIDLSSLTDDGDTTELPDGRVLRLRVQVDQDASINDYESDGKVEWTRNTDGNSYPYMQGQSQRPDGFTGAARIIERDHGSTLWWEPPGKDILGDQVWTREEMRKEESRITELCRYGFKVVTLELLDGKDAYGRPVVRAFANCGAVDEVYPELIEELFSELQHEMETA